MGTAEVMGLVVLPVRLDHETKTASFTLQDGPDRHHIVTVDLEHFDLLETISVKATMLFIYGELHTKRNRDCKQDHAYINPTFIIDLDHTPPVIVDIQLVAIAKWRDAEMNMAVRKKVWKNGK